MRLERLANLADLNLDAAAHPPLEIGHRRALAQLIPPHLQRPHLGGWARQPDTRLRLISRRSKPISSCARALLGRPSRFDPAAIPRVTLTDPPIAEIGLTEPMARARFRTGFSVLRASYAENDMARAGREGMGLVKLIVGRGGQILGAGIVGPAAAELAALFALAIEQKSARGRLAELTGPLSELRRSSRASSARWRPAPRRETPSSSASSASTACWDRPF